MKIEKYQVEIKGTRPLLMNAPNSFGTKKRRSEVEDPEEEAKKRLYRDPYTGKICIPAINIEAMLRDAGRNYKMQGRRATYSAYIKSGIRVEPEYIPLKVPNDDPEKAWKIDARIVSVQRKSSKVIRYRPRFDHWGLEFTIINYDPDILKRDMVERILVDAGKWYGLCDYRPRFGLFEIVKFEVAEKKEKELKLFEYYNE